MSINHAEQWRISCHEAGHAVAGIVLNGRVDGVLLVADGGVAHVDELSPDSHAFMTAAGPAAEHLAEQHAAPEGPRASCEQVAAAELPEGTDKSFAWSCSFADLEGGLRTVKSDDRALAEWAITGREAEPDSWERRIQFARRIAADIVSDHAAAIVRVAERLFIQGRVTGDEIKEQMQ